MKKSVLFIFIHLLILHEARSQQCIADPPSNLVATNISACSATLHWNPTDGAKKYQTRYRLSSTGSWSAWQSMGTDTFFVFNGLQAGKNYDLAVRAKCNDGSTSPVKKKKAKTKTCTLPSGISIEFKDAATVAIQVSLSCPTDTIHYRYSAVGSNWITSYSVNATAVLLQDLIPGTQYVYQVSTCPLSMNNWTTVDTIDLPRPNFLLIVLDDARDDSYSCNGGPSWFQSPNIDRIANEGINFKSSFVVFSYCTPSRGSIVTGLYPHNNGAINNTSTIYPYLPNLATILNQYGYYTGMIGKYMTNSPQQGYDYWLAAASEYVDAKYNFSGINKVISGHNTDVLTDSALAFIGHSDDPFYLWLAYHAPHDSAVAEPEFQGIFAEEQMPVPENTDEYDENYPSFLDSLPDHFYMTPSEIPSEYEGYYELLAGIDHAVGSLLTQLESVGKLNNTMIIFTSDNGHLYGEHGLFLKTLACEPSIRVPLFIRYPAWFKDPLTINGQISLNIDIAPTIVEAAGIPDTFHFDGLSLKGLANGTATRTDMMYEWLGKSGVLFENVPFIRGVRSLNFKYVYYGCDSGTVEEFFNLNNDPGETMNQVNNSDYSSLIQTYRNRLTELQMEFNDTFEAAMKNCFISNPQPEKLLSENPDDDGLISVYPNPSNGWIQIRVKNENKGRITISNSIGQQVFQEVIYNGAGEFNLQSLPAGIYFLRYEDMIAGVATKIIIE